MRRLTVISLGGNGIDVIVIFKGRRKDYGY